MNNRKYAILFGAIGLQFGTGAGCALWAHVAGASTEASLLAFLGGMTVYWALLLFSLIGYSVIRTVKGWRTGDYS